MCDLERSTSEPGEAVIVRSTGGVVTSVSIRLIIHQIVGKNILPW